tara:strand:- start:36 stop:299 length:264 start_codon:yes stop_codon:yes gene_type:complete
MDYESYENYLSVSFDCNRIDAKNGTYKVKYDNFISDTSVIVKSNLIDLKTFVMASQEVKHKSKYWGKFLEDFAFNNKDNTIEIRIGS